MVKFARLDIGRAHLFQGSEQHQKVLFNNRPHIYTQHQNTGYIEDLVKE